MVCDFKAVKTALKGFLDSFDHAMCMNTRDPMYETMKRAYGDRIIGVEDRDPTTEVVARMMFDRIKACLDEYRAEEHPRYPLGRGVRLVRVRVWETSTSWAEYRE